MSVMTERKIHCKESYSYCGRWFLYSSAQSTVSSLTEPLFASSTPSPKTSHPLSFHRNFYSSSHYVRSFFLYANSFQSLSYLRLLICHIAFLLKRQRDTGDGVHLFGNKCCIRFPSFSFNLIILRSLRLIFGSF